MRYLFSIVLLVLLFNSNLQARDITIVTVAMEPYEFQIDGKEKGIAVNIIKEAFKRMGHKVAIEFIPWQRALFKVKYGHVDGILDISPNKKRNKFLLFPKTEIYSGEWVAFKRTGDKFTLNGDLSNAKKFELGVIRGYFYGDLIDRAVKKDKFKKIIKVIDDEAIVKGLFKQDYDMFIGDRTTTLYISKKLKVDRQIDIVKKTETNKEFVFDSSKAYLAFSKKTIDKEFVNKFSNILSSMKKDGTTKDIIESYF